MNKGLQFKISLYFIYMVVGILALASLILLFEHRFHFKLYEHELLTMNSSMSELNVHLEQALLQSIVWTFIGSVILALLMSVFMAKKFTSPLLNMKQAAEQIANGELTVRTQLQSKDELGDLARSLNTMAEKLNCKKRSASKCRKILLMNYERH